jgi:hypothetical protein
VKKLVAVSVLVVSLLAASVAMAANLSMHRAHFESRQYAERQCGDFRGCRHYGVVRCERVSSRKVDCKTFLEFKRHRAARRLTCTQWVDVTKNRAGFRVHAEGGYSAHCVEGWRY